MSYKSAFVLATAILIGLSCQCIWDSWDSGIPLLYINPTPLGKVGHYELYLSWQVYSTFLKIFNFVNSTLKTLKCVGLRSNLPNNRGE